MCCIFLKWGLKNYSSASTLLCDPAELVVCAGYGGICCWEMNCFHPSLVSNNSIFTIYSEGEQ